MIVEETIYTMVCDNCSAEAGQSTNWTELCRTAEGMGWLVSHMTTTTMFVDLCPQCSQAGEQDD